MIDASQSKKPEPSTNRNRPDPLAEKAFYGLAGEVVRAIEPHSEADPAALLVQFLAGFGSIAGRHTYFPTEATWHYPNLYAVIVGQTAKGRKGTSWDQISRVLTGVDGDWRTRVMSGLSTGEGLIWAERDATRKHTSVKDKGRNIRGDEVESDPGVKDKRLFVIEPEFARVLKVAERETNTLAAILREAWDHGDLNILTKKQAARATNAHISIVAHITKDELRRLLTDTAVLNGFANRFLWIYAHRSKLLPEGGALATVNFSPIHAQLRAAMEFAQTAGELRRSDPARDLWREVYPSLSEGKPGLLGAAISRAEAQVVRLSLVYALLDRSPSVLPAHLEAALAVWRYAEDSARFIFGDALGDETADEILRQLRQYPNGMTRNEIREYFQRHKSSAEISRALGVLQEYGLARMERAREQKDHIRPTERWYAIMIS